MSKQLLRVQYEELSGIDSHELQQYADKVGLYSRQVQKTFSADYNSPMSFSYTPADDETRRVIHEAADRIKQINPSLLIVIGIGGSSLGTQAVLQALGIDQSKIYFADTVDPDLLYAISNRMKGLLAANQTVILNVISKSGTTLETIANFEVLVSILKQHYPVDYYRYVVVTTDQDSPLWQYGKSIQAECLTVPKQVGGRYSVFTAVGLFPLAVVGVDIDALCAGAHAMVDACMSEKGMQNPAAISAALLYLHYQHGRSIHDTFVFSPALHALGNWYRQLLAESVGKEHDQQGKVVHVGITPTVSVGTTDLHSVGQLYLAGPDNRFTTFIIPQEWHYQQAVPQELVTAILPNIAGVSYRELMQAIAQGTMRAYTEKQRPFMRIDMPVMNELYLGQYLIYAMMQVMYVGLLCNIDPFNQPEVELYKRETRKILSRG